MIDVVGAVTVDLVAGVTGQFLAVRAEIDLPVGVEREIGQGKERRFLLRSLPAMDSILEAFLPGEARVTFAEVNVGDVSVHLFVAADGQAVKRMVVAVGGELFAFEIVGAFADGLHVLPGCIQHRLEIVVVLAGEGFGGQNDLMFGIDQRLGVVSLHDAVGGGHLDRFVVHGVALDFPAVAAALGLIRFEKPAQALDL